MSTWVDFAEIRRKVSLEDVIVRFYGLTGLKRDYVGGIVVLDAQAWLDTRLALSRWPARPPDWPTEGAPEP